MTVMARLMSLLLAGAAVVADAVVLKAAKPDYKDVVACSKSVSRLATETNTLVAANQNIDRTCDRSLQYYKDMIALKQKSITQLEHMKSGHDSSAELEKEYTERYTTLMCMKTYDAFVGGKDDDDRLEVLHLCIGRTSLAPRSLLHHRSHVEHKVEVHAQACPQAVPMQQRVDMLKQAKKTKVAQCLVKKAELKKELAKKDAREDELEGKHYGHHADKAKIRSKVGGEVTAKFCKVIQPNYKMNEKKIVAFWGKNCPS